MIDFVVYCLSPLLDNKLLYSLQNPPTPKTSHIQALNMSLLPYVHVPEQIWSSSVLLQTLQRLLGALVTGRRKTQLSTWRSRLFRPFLTLSPPHPHAPGLRLCAQSLPLLEILLSSVKVTAFPSELQINLNLLCVYPSLHFCPVEMCPSGRALLISGNLCKSHSVSPFPESGWSHLLLFLTLPMVTHCHHPCFQFPRCAPPHPANPL